MRRQRYKFKQRSNYLYKHVNLRTLFIRPSSHLICARRTPQPIPRTNCEIFVVAPSHGLSQLLRRGHPRPHQLEHLPKGSVRFGLSKSHRKEDEDGSDRSDRSHFHPGSGASRTYLPQSWAHERLTLLAGRRQNDSGMGLVLVGSCLEGVFVLCCFSMATVT